MQIRTRLTLQFILVVTLIILFSFGVLYYSSSNYRRNEFAQRLESKATNTFDMFLNYRQADPAMLIIFDRSQKDKLPRENIRIYDEQNRQIYNSNDSNVVEVSPDMIDKVRRTGQMTSSPAPFELLGLRYTNNDRVYVVFSCAIDKYGLSKLNNLRVTMILLFFLIISIVAFAGWIYAGRAMRPLSEVINDVEKINVESLDKRLTVSQNHDEIGRLIDTFNFMLERVEKSVMLQRLFVSGASHELKNPLTAITSQLQVVMLSDRSNEEYRVILRSVMDDIRKLNRTTLDLIEYARLSYEDEIQTSPVRIDDIIWSSRDYYLGNNPNCRVLLNFGTMPEDEKKLIMTGNEALLKVAFNNLIDNACKFSENKTCRIFLDVRDEQIEISFRDNGVGMDPAEIALIFEPFYRANNTAEVRGHGIGLALTRKIIQVHKARINVESKKGAGTNFTLSFLQA